jgi:hypothetical protein
LLSAQQNAISTMVTARHSRHRISTAFGGDSTLSGSTALSKPFGCWVRLADLAAVAQWQSLSLPS